MKKVWFSLKHTVDLFSSSLHLIWNSNTFFHLLYVLIAICKEGHPTEYENKLKEFHLCRKCTKLKLREYLGFVWEFNSQEFTAEQKWVWQQFSNKYGINGGFTNFRIFQEKSNFLKVLSRVSINTYFPFSNYSSCSNHHSKILGQMLITHLYWKRDVFFKLGAKLVTVILLILIPKSEGKLKEEAEWKELLTQEHLLGQTSLLCEKPTQSSRLGSRFQRNI